jgi:hypothetical protein
MFGLAIHLPDRVLSWIGQHFERFGEVEQAHRHQMGFNVAGGVGRRLIDPMAKSKGSFTPQDAPKGPNPPNPD